MRGEAFGDKVQEDGGSQARKRRDAKVLKCMEGDIGGNWG
jgi:hypothetical protein